MTNTPLPNNISDMKRQDVLFIVILAFVAVTIFSTSSFLYPFNRWVDANCIFTVGKSIFCGKVPYRDLMDHKGFLLHLINGIGSLISFKSFFGVYVMELISGSLFLWACYKTLLLFTDRKVLYLMPFLALAAYGSPCFEQGASAEEFCLPFLSLSLYIGLKSVVNQKALTLREAFLLGVFASCVFWIKYTICGLYVGMGIGLCIFYVQNNLHKLLLKSIGCFCLGVVPVSAAIILYFAYNHALSDLWTVYFYNNLFNYSMTPGRFGLLRRLFVYEWHGLKGIVAVNPLMGCLLLGSLIELYLQKDKKVLVFSLICFFSMFVMVFVGYQMYYPLPFVIGMPFSLLLAMRILKQVTSRVKTCIYLGALLLGVAISGTLAKYKLIMMFEGEPAASNISKLIMNGEEYAPTMVEYNIMDIGVYTLCGYIPECKHFCHLNLSIKEQIDAQDNYIANSHPTYIISARPMSFDGYKLYTVQTQQSTISIRKILHNYLPFVKLPKYSPQQQYYVYRYNNTKAQ